MPTPLTSSVYLAWLPQTAPPELQGIITPLSRDVWDFHLRSHPDRDFVQYLLSGIQNGFRIGFDYTQFSCGKGKRNMLSATKNATVVEDYLRKECALWQGARPIQEGLPERPRQPLWSHPEAPSAGKVEIVDLSDPSGGECQ